MPERWPRIRRGPASTRGDAEPEALHRLPAAVSAPIVRGEVDLSGALARTARWLFEEQPTEPIPTRTVIAEPERV